MTVITDAEQTLLDQLLCQWKESPNILALLGILANPMQDTIDVCEFLTDYTDLDDCEGILLDMFGGLIGIYRPLALEDDANLFRMCEMGEAEDLDGRSGFYDDTDPTVDTGGYMNSLTGCFDQSDPTAQMSDTEFRKMIKQKASVFRAKMTHTNLFNYLIEFGTRCKLTNPDGHEVAMEQADFYGPHALTDFFRYHAETRGFRPGGMRVEFVQNTRKDEL